MNRVFLFHWSVVLLIPGFILGMWAQHRVRSTFRKWSRVPASTSITGRDMAERILSQSGISDVEVKATGGRLSDYYDPIHKEIRLSPGVYDDKSVAALGVAAHECGHAMQHQAGYAALKVRWALLRPANLGMMWAPWIVMIGFFMGQAGGVMIDIGIVLFSAAVLFQIVTLPVEFNASKRAMAQLQSAGMVAPQDTQGVREVLHAAGFTYVAAAAASILTLVQLVILRRER
jgi:Zn-dependent membrane protease YugP